MSYVCCMYVICVWHFICLNKTSSGEPADMVFHKDKNGIFPSKSYDPVCIDNAAKWRSNIISLCLSITKI